MTFTEMHVKWSVILVDQLGPGILTMLEIKEYSTSFASCAAPGWFSDLNTLLTRKLPMFLSHLNEVSGGRANRCFISGIIATNFEVCENDIFDCKVLWTVGEGE